MAVKVVYDSTRGLVQENDATGVGGFQIKDVSLTEGTEDVTTNAAGKDAKAVGVTLVTTGGSGGDEKLKVANGTAVGQLKTVIFKAEGDGNDVLLVNNAANNATFSTLDTPGDVALLVWSGTSWLLVGQST